MKVDDFYKGIIAGKQAFCGPKVLQVDITNNCNTNCIACWCHSDFIGDKKLTSDERKVKLRLKMIKQIVDDAVKLNVQGIQLAGSGDPFCHPDILDIVKYIKKRGLSLEIVTNGILLNEKNVKVLVQNRVDRLAVSVWAGTAKTYQKTHPNQPKAIFDKIKRNLQLIARMKRDSLDVPVVRIYNVISGVNFFEIEKMLDFALQVEANMLEFQAVDIIKGKTEFLKLSSKQVEAIGQQFFKIKQRKDFLVVNKFSGREFDEYGRFVIPSNVNDGFRYFFDNAFFYGAECPLGSKKACVQEDMAKGVVKFLFDSAVCANCVKTKECLQNNAPVVKKLYFLSLVGVSTFLRRISSGIENASVLEYDSKIDNMPCYAGWDFARILTNGDVIPCCKGYLNPIGNIHKNSFSNIWKSKKYNEFREKAKVLSKRDSYFNTFECLKGCDNYGRNSQIHNELRILKLKGDIV